MNRFVTAAVAAATLLLAGCGENPPDAGDDATTTPTADVPTPEPTLGPTPDPTPDPTSGPTTPPEPTPEPTDPTDPVPQPTTLPDVGELIGIPEPGVEAGCWLLDGYLLLGGDRDLIGSGREVRVTGSVERDVATTCQQGIPYRVDTVVGIEPSG